MKRSSVKIRDYSLDNLRCFLIFTVVFAHLLEICAHFSSRLLIYQIIYTFHMPAFLFLFGYHARYSSKRIVYHWCIPFVVFQSAYILFARHILNYAKDFQYTTPYWLLWYMLACIFYQLLLPLFDIEDKHRQVLALFCVFVISLLVGFDDSIGYYLSLSRFFVFQPWFLLGYYCKKNSILELLHTGNKVRLSMTLLSAAILALSVWFLLYAKLQNGLLYGSYSYSNCNSTMGMRATVFFISFCWIFFLFVGLKPFLNKQVFLLTRIGQNAWPIFLLHGFVVKATPIYWPSLVSSPVRVILTTCVILIFFGNQFINQFLYFISFMWLEKGKLNTLKEEKI